MKLVFLLEEMSMKELLDRLLPRILPADVHFQTIPHRGKGDLQKSIPIKLKAWNEPKVKFIIVHDQDSNDCLELKATLKSLCDRHRKPTLIRIACHELEAWYLGDMEALATAYNVKVTKAKNRSKYRSPDSIINPKEELKKLIPYYQPVSGSMKIAQYMDIDNNASRSFNVFIDGVRKFIEDVGE